jgi:hypothetical protein
LLVFNYFRKLKLLKVHHRKSLRYMLAPPMGSIPVQLLELEVKGCPKIEEIVTNDLPGAVDLLREQKANATDGATEPRMIRDKKI